MPLGEVSKASEEKIRGFHGDLESFIRKYFTIKKECQVDVNMALKSHDF